MLACGREWLQPANERRDAARAREGVLVLLGFAGKCRARQQHADSPLNRARLRRAQKADEPFRDERAVVRMLGRERAQRARGVLLRLVRRAGDEQPDERIHTTQLRDRVLVGRVLGRERPNRRRGRVLGIGRALAHERAQRRHRAGAGDGVLVVGVAAGEIGQRSCRKGLHRSRLSRKHRHERRDGARLGDRVLVLAVVFCELAYRRRRERAQRNVRDLLVRRRVAQQHPHKLGDAAHLGDGRLVLLLLAAELGDRAHRVLLGLGARRLEQGQQRRDAVGIDNRLAVVLALAREVGQRGRGHLLRVLGCRRGR